MKRNKSNKSRNTLYALAGFVVLIMFSFIASQGFTVYEKPVYVAEFSSAECSMRPENMVRTSVDSLIDKDGEFYGCTTALSRTGRYIPPGATEVNCEFIAEDVGDFHSAFDCPLNVVASDVDKDSCVRLRSSIGSALTDTSANEYIYTIEEGRQLFIDPSGLLNKPFIDGKIPSYGLTVEFASGYKVPITPNCEFNSLNGFELHEIEPRDSIQVSPLSTVNVATQLSPTISSQVVSLDDVEGGDLIYITRPGYYHKVQTAEDDWKYVDLNKEYSSSKIECMPLFLGCDGEAKIISLDEQTVSEEYSLGVVTGYAPVQGDTTKLCKYEVVNNKLIQSNDCISNIDCPEDEPFWNPYTGECASQQSNPLVTDDDNTLLYLVIGSIVVVFLVMVAASQKKGAKK